MSSAVIYIVLVNTYSTPLPNITNPDFSPSLPFVSPPQRTVAGGASWHMGVEEGTTITVSAPGYNPTVVNTSGPNDNPPFVGTNHETPIEARLSVCEPDIASFRASPPNIGPGESSTTLSWEVFANGAVSVEVTLNGASVPFSGSETVGPGTYTLTATTPLAPNSPVSETIEVYIVR
jgi:hypothetical protein